MRSYSSKEGSGSQEHKTFTESEATESSPTSKIGGAIVTDLDKVSMTFCRYMMLLKDYLNHFSSMYEYFVIAQCVLNLPFFPLLFQLNAYVSLFAFKTTGPLAE